MNTNSLQIASIAIYIAIYMNTNSLYIYLLCFSSYFTLFLKESIGPLSGHFFKKKIKWCIRLLLFYYMKKSTYNFFKNI